MSPELKKIYNGLAKDIDFNPEKSDMFSLGITFLRSILLLDENSLYGLNDEFGDKLILTFIK